MPFLRRPSMHANRFKSLNARCRAQTPYAVERVPVGDASTLSHVRRGTPSCSHSSRPRRRFCSLAKSYHRGSRQP